MKRIFIFSCLLLCSSATAQDRNEALLLADRVVEQMGGREAFNDIRYLRFDFKVDVNGNEVYAARHLWDRWTGRYREEWALFEDEAQALFNVDTNEGRAFRNGTEVTSEAKTDVIEQAKYNYLNDSYWLLMPWKMTDPGVNLTSFEHTSADGHIFDVLHLSFEDSVGESPGDQHWLFVNPETGVVEKTGYFLERFEVDTPSFSEATIWSWSDWSVLDGVQFASKRKVLHSIHDPFETAQSEFTLIATLDDVDDSVFESVSVPMPNQ
jgi:hypothetical protein